MANTLKILAQSTAPATATTLYTVPAATTTVLKTITACNKDASAQTFSIWLVASADSAEDKNALLDVISLSAHETVFVNPDHYLAAGFKIVASGSSTKIGLTISGVEIA